MIVLATAKGGGLDSTAEPGLYASEVGWPAMSVGTLVGRMSCLGSRHGQQSQGNASAIRVRQSIDIFDSSELNQEVRPAAGASTVAAGEIPCQWTRGSGANRHRDALS
jgi:hypothetical protein